MKLYGSDLDTLEQLSDSIKAVLKTVPGVHELALEANKGKPQIVIKVNREAAARLCRFPAWLQWIRERATRLYGVSNSSGLP